MGFMSGVIFDVKRWIGVIRMMVRKEEVKSGCGGYLMTEADFYDSNLVGGGQSSSQSRMLDHHHITLTIATNKGFTLAQTPLPNNFPHVGPPSRAKSR